MKKTLCFTGLIGLALATSPRNIFPAIVKYKTVTGSLFSTSKPRIFEAKCLYFPKPVFRPRAIIDNRLRNETSQESKKNFNYFVSSLPNIFTEQRYIENDRDSIVTDKATGKQQGLNHYLVQKIEKSVNRQETSNALEKEFDLPKQGRMTGQLQKSTSSKDTIKTVNDTAKVKPKAERMIGLSFYRSPDVKHSQNSKKNNDTTATIYKATKAGYYNGYRIADTLKVKRNAN